MTATSYDLLARGVAAGTRLRCDRHGHDTASTRRQQYSNTHGAHEQPHHTLGATHMDGTRTRHLVTAGSGLETRSEDPRQSPVHTMLLGNRWENNAKLCVLLPLAVETSELFGRHRKYRRGCITP